MFRRRFRVRFIQILLISLMAAFQGYSADRGRTPSGGFSTKIVGGAATSTDVYPFMAFVERHDNSYCSGTIIAPYWVLTAAHCVVRGDGSYGVLNTPRDVEHGYRSSYGFTQTSVVRAIPHPDYHWRGGVGYEHDIALVEVEDPYPPEYFAQLALADLEAEGFYAPSNTLATAIGWGRKEGNRHSDGIRHVEIPMLLPNDCLNQFEFEDKPNMVHEDTLCAGSALKGGRSGDSGGPLLVPYQDSHGRKWLQVGVHSISGRDTNNDPVRRWCMNRCKRAR